MNAILHSLVLTFAIVAQAGAHDAPVPARGTQPVPTIAAVHPMPIAARYVEQKTDLRTGRSNAGTWYFWRDANRIETAKPALGMAEIWNRDAGGRITHARFFHDDRRIIDTSSGELLARGIDTNWQKLATLFDPRSTPALRRIDSTRLLGQAATVYRGDSNGTRIEVVWLEHANLPGRLTRVTKHERVDLRLAELLAVSPPDWPRLVATTTDDYLRIDVADLGDMENDPFVRKVLRNGFGGLAIPHAH